MPRGKKRETMSGADAQNIKSVPGQRYGEGVEQQALQRNMPAPDYANESIPVGSAEVMPMGEPVRPAPQAQPAQISEYLAANKPQLFSGTQMPDTPVTDGLAGGPGRGPEALVTARSTTPIARYLQNLARDTGNKKWQHLAERAGLQ